MAKKYLKRIYDDVLEFRLKAKGAVLVEGPKWCGKTTTAEQLANSAIYLQGPEKKQQYLQLAQMSPSSLLEGETPRLIDEWQEAPVLWDAVRFAVDKRGEFEQFILTGSTVPAKLDEMAHTGTGRVARMRMRTMSLKESEDSTGAVSLGALFRDEPLGVQRAKGEVSLEQIAFLVCRGGWPSATGKDERVALQQAIDYLDAVTEVDISKVDGTKRNPQHARALMRSYARMVATQGAYSSMLADLNQSGVPISEPTLFDYVSALEKLFVIEELPAWNPNLRSKTAIRTSPTRHYVDPSIAVAAMGASPSDLINDLNTFGLLFESMCVRDLRVYADALDGAVYHYRDKSDLECDAVLHLRNGKYGLIEIKLGGQTLINEGAASLRKLAGKIDTKKMPAPSFLMVITGVGEFSYVREDGVLVVPIRLLGE